MRQLSNNVILATGETNKEEKPPRQQVTKLLLAFFTVLTHPKNIVCVHIMKIIIFTKKPKM